MANISNASGRLTITAESKAVALLLLDCFKCSRWNNSKTSDYPTYVEDKVGEVDECVGAYAATYDFTAFGRWSYICNLEQLMKSMQEYNDKKGIHLEDFWWNINLEFADEECGCDVLYKADVKFIHREGTSFKDSEFTEEITNYEYTYFNMAKAFDMSIEGVLNCFCGWFDGADIEDDIDKIEELIYDLYDWRYHRVATFIDGLECLRKINKDFVNDLGRYWSENGFETKKLERLYKEHLA